MRFPFLKLFFAFTVSLLMASLSQAATFTVPKLSNCLADLPDSNTQDSKAYFIYSDFYYEFDDKREYAIQAIKNLAKEMAADTSCFSDQVEIDVQSVQCHRLGNDICVVPSDAGDFIVSKDYVDSTNIILVESGYTHLPRIRSRYDSETLWMPEPGACYMDLLKNRDSQAYGVDGSAYRHFQDLRYVLARTTRDVIKDISEESNSCAYQTSGHEASKMQCVKYNTFGGQICALTSTNAGYFQYITENDGGVHILFNRWD